jgi:hypothetical protein
MADTIKVPGFGPTKKTYVYLVGGGAVALLAYSIWRARQAAAAQAAPVVGTADTSQIDPATGYPYGSAEDAAALSAQQTYQNPYAPSGAPGYTPPTATGFTSNAQWREFAVQELVNNGGAAYATVSDALGRYLTGEVVPDNEVSIVNQAIGAGGYPPQSGPNGYPPSIRHGSPGPAQTPLGTAPHVTLGTHRAGAAAIHWTATTGAKSYHVHRNGTLVSQTTQRAITVHGAGNYQVFAIGEGGINKASNIINWNGK